MMAIVEGIIAVANHKLRVEEIEKYKEYLSKKFYSQEELFKLIENARNNCYGNPDKMRSYILEELQPGVNSEEESEE